MMRLTAVIILLFGVVGLFAYTLFGFTYASGVQSEKIDNSYESSIDFGYLESLYNDSTQKSYTTYLTESKPKSILRYGILSDWHKKVAHATGEVNGITGSNSKEAFIKNYERGFRLFEIDMSITKDGKVVAFHDGVEHRIGAEGESVSDMTVQYFKSHSYQGLTLMDADDIVNLMIEYPESYIILDTKNDIGLIISGLLDVISKKAPWLKNRIIPQIYKPLDLQTVESLYAFPDIIFTLYRTDMTENGVIEFVNDSPVTAVTMHWKNRYYDKFKDKLNAVGVSVFVHTVNDKETAQQFANKGVGIYTDTYYETQ